MNIIRHKYAFLGASVVLIGAAIACIAVFGLKQGIDFQGGALWKLRGPSVTAERLTQVLQDDLQVETHGVANDPQTSSYLVRLPAVSEADHQRYLATLKSRLPGIEELSFQSIGPSVGRDLRQKSVVAIILVLVGISLYIAFAFRKVLRPESSWTYGWITLVTLFHDVIIPAGLIAILGHYGKAEIDSNFVVALLVVMGFSVHDTIVVFDRIRENLFLDRGKADFGHVVNESVNQTIARSVNTSLTLILVLVALYVVGPATLKYFILTLLVGVITGIYSSIFVASPLLHAWQTARGKTGK
jgi:preprotein translocase subunit SecF